MCVCVWERERERQALAEGRRGCVHGVWECSEAGCWSLWWCEWTLCWIMVIFLCTIVCCINLPSFGSKCGHVCTCAHRRAHTCMHVHMHTHTHTHTHNHSICCLYLRPTSNMIPCTRIFSLLFSCKTWPVVFLLAYCVCVCVCVCVKPVPLSLLYLWTVWCATGRGNWYSTAGWMKLVGLCCIMSRAQQ